MLFRDTIAACYENHVEHANTLCVQNAEFLSVEEGGTFSYRCVLKGGWP
jgi:hypothetical protein